MSFTSQQAKQPLGHSSGSNSSASPSRTFSASTGSVLPNKTRIRWTPDLHEKFVECANRLGGAESKCQLISSPIRDSVKTDEKLGKSFHFVNNIRFFVDRGDSKGYSEAHGLRRVDHIPHKEPSAGLHLFKETSWCTWHSEVGFFIWIVDWFWLRILFSIFRSIGLQNTFRTLQKVEIMIS